MPMANDSPASVASPRRPCAQDRDPPPWSLAPPPAGVDLASARTFCRRVAAWHYENFTVATRLVPASLRQHLANVYAFARWSDDLADEAASPGEAVAALAAWRRGLEDCFSGRPSHPVYIALADTIRESGLAIDPFSDLLAAFEEDAAFDRRGVTVRYPTRAALLSYCSRSANPVGRIVLALAGCRGADAVAMSDSICTALQLVNFWQDVRRDRLAGRVYLPVEDLDRHGVPETALDGAHATLPLCNLLRDEVAWARRSFDEGAPLVGLAPRVLRPAIRLFLAGGRALADAIERQGFDTLCARPRVGRWTKLALAARAWCDLQVAAISRSP
ncbi:MAG: squalene synthase HpnC [Planctomycetia bacterium]|nr:squalene synthase HpnC [Planctomycetia bacterium]